MTGICWLIAAALLSYAVGSINFAIIISWILTKRDIRKYGSGNAGSTNVVRTVGLIPGLITFVLDFGKGALAGYLGRLAVSEAPELRLSAATAALLCGTVCLLGHVFPIFFRFRGGKGVATSAGVLLAFSWQTLLIALAGFLCLFLPTRIISLGSLVATASVPITAIFFGKAGSAPDRVAQIVLGLIICVTVFLRHRENIKRLLKGEEKPIKPKQKGAD